MTTRRGCDSAARRTGTAKSVHASKNVETRNASFMDGPLRNLFPAKEHGSTGDLGRRHIWRKVYRHCRVPRASRRRSKRGRPTLSKTESVGHPRYLNFTLR